MSFKKTAWSALLFAVALNSSAKTGNSPSTSVAEKHKHAHIPNLFFIAPNFPTSFIVYYLPEVIKKSHKKRRILCRHLSDAYSVGNWPIYFCSTTYVYKSQQSFDSRQDFKIPDLFERPEPSKSEEMLIMDEPLKSEETLEELKPPKDSQKLKLTQRYNAPQKSKQFQIPKLPQTPKIKEPLKTSHRFKLVRIFKSFHIPKFPQIATLLHSSKSYIPKISIQGGAFFATQGRAQHININTLRGDNFSVSNHTSVNGLLGLGLYWPGLKTRYADFSYGVNAYYLPNTVTKGLVTLEKLYTNLSYSYLVTNWPIYFGGKALLHNSFLRKTNITLDAGIGFNVINTHSFTEYPLIETTIPDAIFLNNTQLAFSATAGIGLRFNDFFGQNPLECGYRFFYLGQGSFNKATDQVLDSLKTGTSYANALVCSLTI